MLKEKEKEREKKKEREEKVYLLGVMVHAGNLSTWEAETGGWQIRGQPQLLSEVLCNLVRPCFKIKKAGCGDTPL